MGLFSAQHKLLEQYELQGSPKIMYSTATVSYQDFDRYCLTAKKIKSADISLRLGLKTII